jgi:hypothetical protein
MGALTRESEPMSPFPPIDRNVDFLLPPSVQEWLPEGHLARHVVEVVEGLDLCELERAYAGRGSRPCHPAIMTPSYVADPPAPKLVAPDDWCAAASTPEG